MPKRDERCILGKARLWIDYRSLLLYYMIPLAILDPIAYQQTDWAITLNVLHLDWSAVF